MQLLRISLPLHIFIISKSRHGTKVACVTDSETKWSNTRTPLRVSPHYPNFFTFLTFSERKTIHLPACHSVQCLQVSYHHPWLDIAFDFPYCIQAGLYSSASSRSGLNFTGKEGGFVASGKEKTPCTSDVSLQSKAI